MQGSNLTFGDNSQMASTWSRFISHKCVSTSLGTCAAQTVIFMFQTIQTRGNVKLLLLSTVINYTT